MKKTALLAVALIITSTAFGATELKLSAAAMVSQYASDDDAVSKYTDKPLALTGTLLSLESGLTDNIIGKLGDESDTAVRVTFADKASVDKIRSRVGQKVTLHCVGAFSTPYPSATDCKVK
ncbi:hypothetical protein J2797_006335 [Paraburkholderia terricola]|uniref:hypothetical protein n=1 Tax=Paraburkholderia TaxID=1822464 RepID=UPI001B2680D3|nr:MULTISPECIES: hypothetical protein [Paraburkholderia]MDR6496408.1 hypothetical protein [Paraburkholderia terricola]CAE6792405.1 hypothetical protein LMG22931_05017 [Paraburkholderia nemoris]